MPIITVNILSGRDRARKRLLVQELSAAAVRALDVPLASVRIIINEMPPEHFGVGGETSADIKAKTQE